MKLHALKKHELESLQFEIRVELKKRYRHSGAPKYGNLDKSFSDEEIKALFSHIRHHTAYTVLTLMTGLGLRICEACSLKTHDIDLSQRRLWVSRTEKGSTPTLFFLHDRVFNVLRAHMENGYAGTEWLFPAVKSSNKYPHISPNWVRKEFREARAAAGLNFSYGWSDEHYPGHKSRPLYRLVSHSCRHYFGHKVFESTKDILITQKLMRHVNIRNTQRYMHKRQEELDNAMAVVFG